MRLHPKMPAPQVRRDLAVTVAGDLVRPEQNPVVEIGKWRCNIAAFIGPRWISLSSASE